MKIKIHIHPDYWMYKDFIEAIPIGNYIREEVYCNYRNIVERVKWHNHDFVIKQYKRPTWANCIVYTWFRKTKAQRAYEYALELLKHGFETAYPIAYIEIKKHGLFHTGYFISERIPYPLLKDLEAMKLPKCEQELVVRDFINFTAHLHKHGILPKDYNAGNIFFHKEGEHYQFALIDINRLQLGKQPNEQESALFFEQMGVSITEAISTIEQYATIRGFNTERCIFFILLHRLRKQLERKFKKQLLHPLRKKGF